MDLWKRRALKTVLAIVLLVVATSLVYHYIMVVMEGQPRSYFRSLQIIVETYTGTGFGSDSPWMTPLANLFIIFVDLSTFLLLFIILPYVFQPVLEESLSPEVPDAVDASNHVVVCGVAQQGERLIDEFRSRNIDYAVVVDSESKALELHDEGHPTVYGDLSSVETLEAASLEAARAVVVDTADDHAASVVLAIREIDEQTRTIVLASDGEFEQYLEYAGADEVLTPRQLLGQRLARRISTEVSPGLSDTISLGNGTALLELTVFADSPICGDRLADIEARNESVVVPSIWQGGRFVPNPTPETIVDEDTVLLIAGAESALSDLEDETYAGREQDVNVVIAGYGMVGSTVAKELQTTTADCTVVDIENGDDIDVVGDATRPETLREAGIEDATAFAVALHDDDQAILSVLVANELVDSTDILVRVNEPESTTKVRRAGAGYVLSLPEISGRMLALEVLQEEILTYDRQLKIVRLDASKLDGARLSETIIAETDCAVVALNRNGEFITDIDDNVRLQDDDELLVVGSDAAIDAIEP